MRSTVAAALTMTLLMLASAFVNAQESIAGKYTGNYQRKTNQGLQATGIVVVLESAEGGVVRGTLTILAGQCIGDYALDGKLAEGKLQLRTTEKGGRASDCGLRLNLAVEGNKLTGTTGAGHQAELSK